MLRDLRFRAMLTLFGLVGVAGCHDGGKGGTDPGSGAIELPRVYPPVRAATPTGLIADAQFAAAAPMTSRRLSEGIAMFRSALSSETLATIVRDRLYSPGPTEILRVVSELDGRTAGLDTEASRHACLTAAPTEQVYSLPAGESFAVKLQCQQTFADGTGWIAFGFDHATAPADAGADAGDGGALDSAPTRVGDVSADSGDFYLVEGQPSGNGGAYHLDRTTGAVEAWIAVADSTAPSNSQVLMHMLTASGTLELTLGGAAVGFCAAHFKSDASHLFIDAKTNAPPPPGAPMAGQYCDTARTGCFDVAALDADLGGDAPACAALTRSSFAIAVDLDASADASANIDYSTIYTYLNRLPPGVPAF